MMILDKRNFSLRLMRKERNSSTAPKLTFYPDFRICFVVEGEALWEIEDERYTVRTGDVIFLNRGQKRRFISFGENGFTLCIMNLSRSAFSEISHFTFFLDCVKRKRNVFSQYALMPVLEEIRKEWEVDRPFRYELASAKLTEFFIKARRVEHYFPKEVSAKDRRMLEIMNEIDAALPLGISIASAAKLAGMTESSFSRRFSALNGISFSEYVTDGKIRHAIFLLQTTDLKMLDVALSSGFESLSGFYDAFKKRTGMTPAKYVETEQ